MAFTIYDLIFERVEFKQVELLAIALCGASWFVSCSLALSLVSSEISIYFLSTIPGSLGAIHRPLSTILGALSTFLVPWHHPSPSSAQFLISPPSVQSLSCIVNFVQSLSILAPLAWSLSFLAILVQSLLHLGWLLGGGIAYFLFGACWKFRSNIFGASWGAGYFLFVVALQGSAWLLLVVGCCERCWLLVCSLWCLLFWRDAGFLCMFFFCFGCWC